MRYALSIVFAGVLLAGAVNAAEKPKAARLLEASRAAVTEVLAKNNGNKVVATDLELTRALLKKAEETMEKGQQWWLGAGEVKPETEQEIVHLSKMIDLSLAQVASRLERARKEEELANVAKQLNTVKARLKIFEDRRAEMDRLRAEVARLEVLTKDLAAAQADKTKLTAQVQQLMVERAEAEKAREAKKLSDAKLTELTVLNAKLVEQVEKLSGGKQASPVAPEQQKGEAPPAVKMPAQLPQESAPVSLPVSIAEPVKKPASPETAAPVLKPAQ